jgi:hypothetical protein
MNYGAYKTRPKRVTSEVDGGLTNGKEYMTKL